MPRYLLELRHQDEHASCVRALETLERTGSHFVTQANFGCGDGDHAGWLIVDVDSRMEALQIVPPEMRSEVRVVELKQFTHEQIAAMVKELESK